ncbi:MAG: ribulose 1,5-bisphosphate carboxylase [Saprospiraceae bacterium]|nr:ribulose 1,5-bisphosphate carboxylase [Saprospiraceae bacterium]
MSQDRIKATYLVETAYDLEQAAQIMAGEQSCGTFLRTPGESDSLRANHLATVDHLQKVANVAAPSLPGARSKSNGPIQQAYVTLSWPLANVGINLSSLVSTIAGNLFELAPFSGIKLLDFEVPDNYISKYPGPAFGVAGTRRLVDVYNRPIIGTIIKPSVGLTPQQSAMQTKQLVTAGLDFIKDDELQADSPHSPFEARVSQTMQVLQDYADATGRKPMYAFNISGDMDDMMGRHDFLIAQGATCLMVNLNWVGISAVVQLSRHTAIPIHGHRCGWGMFNRAPVLGMAFSAYQKIWRLAGVDHIHTNGIRNKFCEDDASVIASIKACQSDFIGQKSPMAVLSSGQWAGQAADTFSAIGNTDLMYLCGGGIVAHPAGMTAGVKSIQQAWQAATDQVPLSTYSQNHIELRQAMEFFGKLEM